jgi:hypothetical protein
MLLTNMYFVIVGQTQHHHTINQATRFGLFKAIAMPYLFKLNENCDCNKLAA